MSEQSKCPFTGAGTPPKFPTGRGTSNRDWWPNGLNLKVLSQHSSLVNPMGSKFDYRKEFKKLNIETNKSSTNFLLINFDKVKKNSSKIFELLADAGILVRKMNNYKIKNSLRVTIGKNDENKKFILKLKKAINV